MTNIITLPVNEILFSQDTIKNTFKSGENVEELISKIKNGKVNIEDIKKIRVVEIDGKKISLDNRRLYVLKTVLKRKRFPNQNIEVEVRKFSRILPVSNLSQLKQLTDQKHERTIADELERKTKGSFEVWLLLCFLADFLLNCQGDIDIKLKDSLKNWYIREGENKYGFIC